MAGAVDTRRGTLHDALHDTRHDTRHDKVFKALADPGRRALLDALFQSDGRSLGELCDVLPDLTRFGVMKHVGVLVDAGLVVAHKVGRTKFHYLNPVPIREIHDRWTSKYAAVTTEALVGLRRHIEGAR